MIKNAESTQSSLNYSEKKDNYDTEIFQTFKRNYGFTLALRWINILIHSTNLYNLILANNSEDSTSGFRLNKFLICSPEFSRGLPPASVYNLTIFLTREFYSQLP